MGDKKDLSTNDVNLMYVFFISFVAALGGFLFGYDTAVISGTVGFLRSYFNLAPAMLGWAVSCALVGCILGVSVAGYLSDKFGRKNVLILSAALFFVGAVGTALPKTFEQFILFRILGGMGIGVASMISPLYIAEVSPRHLRGRMVTLYQLAITTGIVLVYFVNYFIAGISDEAWGIQYGWRIMFGSGTIPALFFLSLIFVVPKSPRWLVKKDKNDKAMSVLTKIEGETLARVEMKAIKETLKEKDAPIKELFKPGLRAVLFIGIILAVFQQATGINSVIYYAPEIFKLIGGTTTNSALFQTAMVGTINMLFTVIALFTVDKWGRKPLMLSGATSMGICLLCLGIVFYVDAVGAWVLPIVLLAIASFAYSLGPVTWVVISEIFPNRIRGRAVSIAILCLWGANYVVSQTFPMMNENTWFIAKFNHAFPFWVYALFCIMNAIFIFIFVPETKNKSLEEIEKIWVKQ